MPLQGYAWRRCCSHCCCHRVRQLPARVRAPQAACRCPSCQRCLLPGLPAHARPAWPPGGMRRPCPPPPCQPSLSSLACWFVQPSILTSLSAPDCTPPPRPHKPPFTPPTPAASSRPCPWSAPAWRCRCRGWQLQRRPGSPSCWGWYSSAATHRWVCSATGCSTGRHEPWSHVGETVGPRTGQRGPAAWLQPHTAAARCVSQSPRMVTAAARPPLSDLRH